MVQTVRIHTRYFTPECLFLSYPLFISTAYGLTGLARGGQQVSKCKEIFGKAVKLMVDLATMQVRERLPFLHIY